MQIGRIIREKGRTGIYVHHDGKKAAMVVVEGGSGDDTLLSEICMHITFAQPGALSQEAGFNIVRFHYLQVGGAGVSC
jgi:translation elongation factor EF-Ts